MATDWLGRSIPVNEIVTRAIEGDTGFRRLLAGAGELLLGPLRASYEKHSFVKRDDVDEVHYPMFKVGKFLDNDNCLGAAGLVLRHSSRLK